MKIKECQTKIDRVSVSLHESHLWRALAIYSQSGKQLIELQMEAGVPFDASTRIMAGRSLIARPNSRAFRSLALSARQDLQYPAVNREGDRWQDAGWSSCPSSIHGRLPCLLIICSKR
ncbi:MULTISPECIES: hypothetical protein [unclassified Rhizobium]|uniref:hypothetical protein n=1 Tax=unclassified Rhizobium TaxID=2613769 RepID=UPI0011A99BC7|nr:MULTISPECIES: hypothetical protein [unclassified Rhizobium]